MRAATALAVLLVATASSVRADSPEEIERLWLDATRGIVPQVPRASDLFRRARPVEADVYEGMLICEIEVTGERWDGTDPLGPVGRSLGRAEIDAEITLPGRDDRIRFRGPDDQNRVYVSVPGVRLVHDDALVIALADRDVFANDPIGHLTLTYTGNLPFSARSDVATIECRGATRSVVDAKIEDTLAASDAALAALERDARPDRQDLGFRAPDADPRDAWVALYDFATWVGYADPRFLERRDTLRTREVAHVQAVQDLVRSLFDAAPANDRFVRIERTPFSLRVEQYDCKLGDMLLLHPEVGLDVPMECALRVVVRNADRADATLTASLHAVDELGATEPLPRVALVQDEQVQRLRTLRFAPGDSTILVPTPTRHAILLRIASRRGVVFVRIPSPVQDPDAMPIVRREPARAP